MDRFRIEILRLDLSLGRPFSKVQDFLVAAVVTHAEPEPEQGPNVWRLRRLVAPPEENAHDDAGNPGQQQYHDLPAPGRGSLRGCTRFLRAGHGTSQVKREAKGGAKGSIPRRAATVHGHHKRP